VEPGEDPAVTAAREALEETGWKAAPLELLCSYSADNGITDARFHLFRAVGATYQGPPMDAAESSRIELIPLASISSLIQQGGIDDRAALAALHFLLALPASLCAGSQPRATRTASVALDLS
jgi:8-oxo-dGTP pyrophosphatase MutT (NUDIX family)